MDLLAGKADVISVVPDFDDDGSGGWRGSVFHHAKELGWPVRRDKLNTPASIQWLREQHLDFIFSFQYYEILRQPIHSAAKNGTINLHFAPLPRYRGCSPIAWAVMNGEREMGVTLHYIDDGIDTGDIIAQRFFPIPLAFNARNLFEQCIEEGAILFEETLPAILARTNARTPQDPDRATYYGMHAIDFRKRRIDWHRPTEILFHWIRAFAFPPLQFAETGKAGQNVPIAQTERRLLRPTQEPGTVIQLTDKEILVATLDGALAITAFAGKDGQPEPPASRETGWRVREVLG
jgi:methionyl-tRNA formyltransferase